MSAPLEVDDNGGLLEEGSSILEGAASMESPACAARGGFEMVFRVKERGDKREQDAIGGTFGSAAVDPPLEVTDGRDKKLLAVASSRENRKAMVECRWNGESPPPCHGRLCILMQAMRRSAMEGVPWWLFRVTEVHRLRVR